MSAVLAGAAAVGLDVDPRQVTVLRERANLVVHLVPHPVVARTPLWTALVRPDPEARLGLEVRLARWAAGHGGAVVLPCPGATAGPHHVGDAVVTLWPWVPSAAVPTDPLAVGPAVLGRALAGLHASLAGYDGPLPGPEEIGAYCSRAWRVAQEGGVVTPAQAADGTHEVAEVLADVTTAVAALPAGRLVPLHGDAHHGNVVLVESVLTWWDLEDAWRGPVEWDVAVMASALADGGRADGGRADGGRDHGDVARLAVDAYRDAAGVVLDPELLALCARLRAVQGRAWAALVRVAQTRT